MNALALCETSLKGIGYLLFQEVFGVSRVQKEMKRKEVSLLLNEQVDQSIVEWKEESLKLMQLKVKLEKLLIFV